MFLLSARYLGHSFDGLDVKYVLCYLACLV